MNEETFNVSASVMFVLLGVAIGLNILRWTDPGRVRDNHNYGPACHGAVWTIEENGGQLVTTLSPCGFVDTVSVTWTGDRRAWSR